MAKRKNIMKEFEIGEISSVDRPAQPGAKSVIMKRKFSAKERKTDAKSGIALPDGSFPIENEKDLKNAMRALGRAKDRAKAIAHIRRRAKALGVTLPDTFGKALAVTTVNAGHAHTLSTFGQDAAEMRSGQTSYDSNGVEGEMHTHSWITDESGNIIIADSHGHTHGLAALITKNEDISPEEDPLADLLSKGNEPASEKSEDNTMTDEEKKQLADLEKSVAEQTARAEKAEQIAKLNDSEKEYLKSLEGEKADEFLAKSDEDRKSEIEEMAKADAVVYTDMDGLEYRKSDDSRLLAMAKRADTERKARLEIEKKAADAELAKAAESLSHLPGEDEDRIALMKGISLLGDEDKEKALKCLNASEEAMSKGFDTLGTSQAPKGSESYDEALDAIAKTLREKDPTLTEAQAMVKAMESDEGLRIYAKQHGLNS